MMQAIADLVITLDQSPELSLVVKLTILAILGLAAVRYARAARASVRHLVLTSTFAALLALPAAMLIAPAIAIELPWASPLTPSHQNDAVANVAAVPTPVATSANDGASARNQTTPLAGSDMATSSAMPSFTHVSWLAMMRVIWIAGAALMLAMLAIALVRLRTVRRTGLPWLERRDEVTRMAREAGVSRPVAVVLHERIPAPLTCGWRHPVVVFPNDAREWSDGDVRRVLLHELEHVRRGDWIVQIAARTICSIYWFHPLVWTALRQLCLEAERACDDAVVMREAETDYAEQLVALARRMSDAPAHAMVAMASRSDLSARVTALLDRHQRRGKAGIMTFVAAVGAAAVITITIGPLRAVATAATQSSGTATADGRGSGSGSGSGSGAGSGIGRGARAGTGAGAGAGSGVTTVIAGGPGAAVGGVPGGVASGVAGGIGSGEPGAAVGGIPAGVSDGPAGAAVGGVPGGVADGVPGAAVGGILDGVSGAVVVHREAALDNKRRGSRADRALGEALTEAAADGDVKAIEELLAAGVDVNMKVEGDGSALIAAAKNGQISTMKFLLTRGASVNMGVEGDGNPLIAAAASGHTAGVTLLLEQGADIEAVVDGDENALIRAAENGRLEIVKLLVGRGANVNASVRVESNFNGQPRVEDRTPLSMAQRGGHAAVVAFLQSAGAVQ